MKPCDENAQNNPFNTIKITKVILGVITLDEYKQIYGNGYVAGHGGHLTEFLSNMEKELDQYTLKEK